MRDHHRPVSAPTPPMRLAGGKLHRPDPTAWQKAWQRRELSNFDYLVSLRYKYTCRSYTCIFGGES